MKDHTVSGPNLNQMANDCEGMSLKELAHQLDWVKRRESAAKEERIKLEERIAALVPFDPNERKQKTEKFLGGKVVVRRGWNYKADLEAIEKHTGLYLTKEVFDSSLYEHYRKYAPEVFEQLSKYVIVTPAKVSVSVEIPDES